MAGVQLLGKKMLGVNVQGQTRNLVVLAGNGSVRLFEAHPLVEAFNKEHGTNLTIVSHKVANVALTVGETWRSLPTFPVDAFIAYEKPGTRLGKKIVFSPDGQPKVVLATGKYKGEKDVALVALGISSADFKKDGNSITSDIPESRLILVPNFPGPNRWYMLHAETGVPHGVDVAGGPGTGCLYRLNNSSYAGFLVRSGDNFNGMSRVINACYGASYRLGMVAEVPEGDVAKIQALISTPAPAKTDERALIEVSGVSIAKLNELYHGATEAVDRIGDAVDAQLLAPLKEFLAAMGKTHF